MTVRNVGIVFAPTLNIPAPLISFFLTDYPDIFGAPNDEPSSPVQDTRHHSDEFRSPRKQSFSDAPTPAYSETSFHSQQPMAQEQWNGRPPSQFPMPMTSAPSYAPPQPPQQQQRQQHTQYAGYDTGHVPMRPTYDSPGYEQQYQGGEGYGSLNTSRPPGSAREQKQRRRESGMLLMGMGMGQPRKGSNGSNPPRHRDDYHANPMLIREETAFD